MRTTKQIRVPRPTFREIQNKWRLFRFASTLLPSDPGASETPAIEAISVNENCIEVVSDTLQNDHEGVILQAFTFSGLFSLLFAVMGGFGGWSVGVLIFSLGLPAWELCCFSFLVSWGRAIDTDVRKYVSIAVAVVSITSRIPRKAWTRYGNLIGIGSRASGG